MPKERKLPILELFGPTISGEGLMTGTITHFLRTGGCGLSCSWCVAGQSRILMADWTHKKVQDIKVGDYVMGIEQGKHNSRLQRTKVIKVHENGIRGTISVASNENILQCTPDHKLYTNFSWQHVSEAREHTVVYTLPQGSHDNIWRLGWLAGMAAGDGSYSKSSNQGTRFDLDSKDEEIIDFAEEISQWLGIQLSRRTYIAHSGSLIHKLHTARRHDAEDLRKALTLPNMDIDYSRGWIAGFFDAEGCRSKSGTSYTISQSRRVNPDKIVELKKHLCYVDIEWLERDTGRDISTFKIRDWVRMLSYCRPILRRKYPDYIGKQAIPTTPVVITKKIRQRQVYDLTTDVGSYVAEGFIVHNCDSMFAVTPKLIRKHRTMMTTAEILDAIEALPPAPYITFTGGDPCLHKTLGDIVPRLNTLGMRVAVETQGQLFPEWLDKCDVITFSPKGPSSGNEVDTKDLLDWLVAHGLRKTFKVCIKIVVFNKADFKYALKVYEQLPPGLYDAFYFTAGTPMLLSKMHRTAKSAARQRVNNVLHNQRVLADLILTTAEQEQVDFNDKVHLGCQQHVLLWPTKHKGV